MAPKSLILVKKMFVLGDYISKYSKKSIFFRDRMKQRKERRIKERKKERNVERVVDSKKRII